MPTRFHEIRTADSSPTLAPLTPDGEQGEAMHSLAGALGETREVYGQALDWAIDHTGTLSVLVVGLGLGYIEWLALARAAQAGIPCKILSFELEPELRENALALIHRQRRTLPSFEAAARCMAEAEGLAFERLIQLGEQALSAGNWRIEPALSSESRYPTSYNAICYDAYSSKSSPELWEEPFLDHFLQSACAPSACLTTYAAKGTLKRSLARAGFSVERIPGFAGKRERFFAWRADAGARD